MWYRKPETKAMEIAVLMSKITILYSSSWGLSCVPGKNVLTMKLSTYVKRDGKEHKIEQVVEADSGFGNSSSPLILNQTAREIAIQCWAPASFTFQYDGFQTNRDARVEELFINGTSSNQRCYTAKLIVDAMVANTGNYSCILNDDGSGQAKALVVSKYLFVTADSPGVLLGRHAHPQPIPIERVWRSKSTVIPCLVSDPSANVSLYALPGQEPTGDIRNQEKWSDVTSGVKFDPTLGFKLNDSQVRSSTYYKCASSLTRDSVYFRVTSGKSYKASPSRRLVIFKPGVAFNISCRANEPITITDQGRSENSSLFSGEPIVIQKPENQYFAVTKSVNPPQGYRGAIQCETKASKDVKHSWVLEEQKLPQNRETAPEMESSPKLSGCPSPQVRRHPCANLLECNVRRCQKYDPDCTSITPSCDNSEKGMECSAGEVFQCASPGYESASQVYIRSMVTQKLWFTWVDEYSLSDVLIVKTDHANSGSKFKACYQQGCFATFVCQASTMVFSSPLTWSLIIYGANGSISIDSIPEDNISRTTWDRRRGVIQSKVSIALNSSLGIMDDDGVFVRCSAPVWDPKSLGIEESAMSQELGVFQDYDLRGTEGHGRDHDHHHHHVKDGACAQSQCHGVYLRQFAVLLSFVMYILW